MKTHPNAYRPLGMLIQIDRARRERILRKRRRAKMILGVAGLLLVLGAAVYATHKAGTPERYTEWR